MTRGCAELSRGTVVVALLSFGAALGGCGSPGTAVSTGSSVDAATASGSSRASSALMPVSSIPASPRASAAGRGESFGWFADSAPTTGASASARGDLPAEVDAKAFSHDRVGAVTFARTYLAAVAMAWSTLEPSWLRGWSSPSCHACSERVEKITSLRAQGRRPAGAHVIHANLAVVAGRGDQYVVMGPVSGRDAAGSPTTPSSDTTAPATTTQFIVSWVGGRWVIGGEDVVATPG